MPALPFHLKECARKAERARRKASPLGPDIDPGRYRSDPAAPAKPLGPEDRDVREAALSVGVDLSGKDRSGTYLQVDHSALCRSVRKEWEGQVEIRPVAEALEEHPRIEQYWWKAAAVDTDKYTAYTALRPPRGYFVRILPGCRVDLPLQSCLLLAAEGAVQDVHNIIVAEEGSEAQIITGCTVHPSTREGLHIGVSEFYVRRRARLTFTMIHSWSREVEVRPRSVAVVDEEGVFVSNYILMRPVRSLQMYPLTVLRGARSRSRSHIILLGREDSRLDVGSRTVLEGEDCRAETVTRAIARDRSSITARGRLEARTDRCRGHLECRGMIASAEADLMAVPELEADGVPHAELSHEAAISPITEEEVAYLMSRGMEKEEAVSAITRGFLNVELMGLPPVLKSSVERLTAATPAEGSHL